MPAFIKAYTLFAAELDPIPLELMQTLHKMCDTYILGFIPMSGYHRRNGVFNIQSLFAMLYRKGEGLFRNFLNEFCKLHILCKVFHFKNFFRQYFEEVFYIDRYLLL